MRKTLNITYSISHNNYAERNNSLTNSISIKNFMHWQLQKKYSIQTNQLSNCQQQAVWEAATICPAPCKLTFVLLTLKVLWCGLPLCHFSIPNQNVSLFST